MILRSMMRRGIQAVEETKQSELTPIKEEPSSHEGDLSVVKRFGNMTFVSPYIVKNTAHKSNEKFGLTPLIDGLNEMQLISTNKRIRDDFELKSTRKNDRDLALNDMVNEYEKVAK